MIDLKVNLAKIVFVRRNANKTMISSVKWSDML